MASKQPRGGIEMNVQLGRRSAATPSDDTPFRILVLGPFADNLPASTKPVNVDVTEIDELIERWCPSVSLTMGDGSAISISFEALDDFHPDALYDRLPVFAALRKLRKELQDPATFSSAVAKIRKSTEGTRGPTESDETTMERLLGKPSSVAGGPAMGESTSSIEALVRNLVAPHIVRAPPSNRKAHLNALDVTSGELMRAILHHPTYQTLEAAWRGLDFLLRSVEQGLDVSVWNIGKDGLEAAVSVEEPLATHLGRRLVGEAGGEPPWALVVGVYTFGPTERDARLVQRLSSMLSAAGVPLIAGADPALVHGDPAPWPAWAEVRTKPEAAMVALALPRFLLRLPYGKRTDEISRFVFEEQGSPPDHEGYLWGHPAWLVACLLGRSYARAGWRFAVQDTLSLQGVPVHTFTVDGEVEQTPCAEVWMGAREAEAWLAQGITPLCSVRGRDEVQLLRIQSIADPLAPLAGRWR
jgi:type VI secretion system protein ImpC